jgi:hypothetical protein
VLVAGEKETPLPVRAGMPPHRDVRGEIQAMALYASQSAHLITSVEPAGAIVRELAGGAEELLRAW